MTPSLTGCFLLLMVPGLLVALPDIEIQQGRRLYTNYKVLRAHLTSDTDRAAVLQLEDDIDFWSEIGSETEKVDFMVDPLHLDRISYYLAYFGVGFEVLIDDVQTAIDNEETDTRLPVARNKRQNSLFDLLPFFSSQARPRRKPQFTDGETRNRHPRKFPSTSTSSFAPSPNSPISNFDSKPQSGLGQSPCAKTGMNWKQYQSVDTINSWLDCMQQHFGHKMSVRDIGRSSEGRPLKLVQIGEGGTNKPAVFIDGGIHAREWVSPAAVTYLIHRMVETEGEYNSLLDKFTVYVLPVVNPDGYEYSREHDRMWRKTRSKTGGRNLFGDECKGVDLNRNFGYHWGGYGASNDPCKETFRGPAAFSEPESQAIKNFLLSGEADFQLYLTFHSYGQYLLYPWGYDKLDTRDWRDLKHVGDVANNAIRRLNHGVSYQVGSAAKMLYPASGGSDDWAKGGANIKYSYTVELPDTGKFGFLLPARHIIEVGDQATSIIKAMLTEIGK